MTRLKRFGAILLLITVPFLLFANIVSAAEILWSGDINLKFNIEPFDACPNIPGIQPQVPPGMQVDEDGNCYTPPEPPQPPIDLCNNIPGIQVVIPPGYYRDRNGNCWPQPTPPAPPVDLCPNLPGVQEVIPDDHYLDPETNECLPVTVPPDPPIYKDVCHNIPGIQLTTPPGMVNDNGYCYTPPPPSPPDTQEPPLANLPDFLQPIGRFFLGLIPEPIREFFRRLPSEIVNQIPIYIFILVLIFILIPLPQSIREYLYKRRLLAFYKRERNIAEEKNNFLVLASHYLRTPITIMKDSISLMRGTGDIPTASAATMEKALQSLNTQISANIDSANANAAADNTISPEAITAKPFWQSGFFWLPIILSILLTILANFLIGVVGDKQIGINNALLQIVIIVIFIVVLYLIVRNYQIQKKLRREKEVLIAQEQSIDNTRNQFIEKQTANIGTTLSDLRIATPTNTSSKAYSLYNDGYSRLKNVYGKFAVLPFIKTAGNRNAVPLNLKFVIDQLIAGEQYRLDEKQLTVENFTDDITVVQNESLFSFVLSSVFDNAIKFTDTGGRIVISSQPQTQTIRVKISDNGRGIDPAKLDQLFKPFSRAESAIDFSHEGFGLSLFLNRLILNYTGGSIGAVPRAGGGTDVVITTPININPDDVVNKTLKNA